jgi:lipoprotein NlpD
MMLSKVTLQAGRHPLRMDGWAASAAGLAGLAVLAFLGGCASPLHRAPVEDRKPQPVQSGSNPGPVRPVASAAGAASGPAAGVPKLLPGAENAGKPGYYTVKPGDTLLRVALDYSQSWRDLARWNKLDNPNVIEVGQVLRVVPPSADANGVSVQAVAPSGRIDRRSLDGSVLPSSPTSSVPSSPPPSPTSSSPPLAAGAAASAAAAATPLAGADGLPREADARLGWIWPADGPVLEGFDEAKVQKGLDIGGKAGDPVLAAADGRVIYAGADLRGYGNLVIIKHNATYLSAYAHNQSLLVKEDEIVRRGEKIAEMGSSDSDRVELHFEIRRDTKPIDPLRLLPPR